MRRWLALSIRYKIATVVGPVAAVVIVGAVLLSSPHRAPVTLRPTPSPSESLSPSPTPAETPSPTPIPSPASAPSAQAPAPVPTAPACSTHAGGFPASGTLSVGTPTAMAWAPDGRLFFTDRGGTVYVYQGGQSKVFATVPTVTVEPGGGYSERGLLGLALSPGFSQDHLVYAFYSRTDYSTQAVIRWTDCGGTGTAATTIISLPSGSDCCHKGGRLAFGPDGHLYVTLGDEHTASSAQDPADPRGKVLRYDPNGGGRSAWVLGLRNPFGIAFAPDGTLAVTNNGPSGDAGTPCGSCGDEFYLVGHGGGVDYQWPYCWGYSHQFNGSGSCHGLPGPQYSTEGGPYAKSSPFFVAPTGMTWDTRLGDFVFCAYSTGEVYQYVSQGSVRDTGIGTCRYDVKQGPDGALYTATDGGIHRAG